MPSKLNPKAKGQKEALPPPPDFTEFKSLRKSGLDEFASRYRERSLAIKKLEEEKKDLAETMKSLMSSLPPEVKSVAARQLRVTLAHGKTASKIDARKLLENGVEPAVIKASTVEGESYPYVLVTPLSEDE